MEEEARPKGRGKRAASPFVAAVRLAYRSEHGAKTDTRIAEIMGLSKSALSQLFGDGSNYKRETLDKFLAPVATEALRRSILAAYDGETFAREAGDEPGRSLPERVAALAHGNRPDLALGLAMEGLVAGTDRDETERWTLFLLAFKLAFRLDAPGEAMRAASLLKEWGESQGRPELVAAALAASARAMRRTTLFTARDVQAERQRARGFLEGAAGLSGDRLAAAAFARDLLDSEDVADVVRVHESMGGREGELRGHLAALAARRSRMAKSKAGLARAWQLETTIQLALGELDAAERALEEALSAGGNGLPARLECGRLKGRLLAERGETGEAHRLLSRMAEICERDRYVYLQRLAQTEIARIARPRVDRA